MSMPAAVLRSPVKRGRGQGIKGPPGWRILVEEGKTAQAQMARDTTLAGELFATARFFRWNPPAVSLGLRQPSPSWLSGKAWSSAGLEAVERPTGGGLAFHGSDVSISVVVPRLLDLPLAMLMETVCKNAVLLCRQWGVSAEAVLETPVAGRITYCLTELSPYAVMVFGKKVAGFALRRFPQTWLIQGSLLVGPLPQPLAEALPGPVAAQLKARAISLSEACGKRLPAAAVARQWAGHWAGWWEEALLEALARN